MSSSLKLLLGVFVVLVISGLILGGYIMYKQRFETVREGEALVRSDLERGKDWVRNMVSNFPYETERGSGVQKVPNYDDQVAVVGQVQEYEYPEIAVRTSYATFEVTINAETVFSVASNVGGNLEYNLVNADDIGLNDLVYVRVTDINGRMTALEVQKILK